MKITRKIEKKMYSKEDFEIIKSTILEEITPYKILLFGSYSKGLQNEDSDIDIAIITELEMERKHKLKTINNLLISLARLGYDADIIIKPQENYSEMAQLNGTLSYTINHQGQEMKNSEFKAVDFMRQVRDKISKDIQDFDYKQIKEYFAKKKQKARIIPSLKVKKHS